MLAIVDSTQASGRTDGRLAPAMVHVNGDYEMLREIERVELEFICAVVCQCCAELSSQSLSSEALASVRMRA